MIKKLIRMYLVYKAEVEFVKEQLVSDDKELVTVDENSEDFDKMTDSIYEWIIDTFKFIGIAAIKAAIFLAVITGVITLCL